VRRGGRARGMLRVEPEVHLVLVSPEEQHLSTSLASPAPFPLIHALNSWQLTDSPTNSTLAEEFRMIGDQTWDSS
jgi:hypothetical protein